MAEVTTPTTVDRRTTNRYGHYDFQLLRQQKVHHTLHTDSTSATSLASKLGVNRRSRHISLRHLWIQDLRQAGEVDIRRVTTHENPADIYTKLLPAATLQKHLPQNGLLALPDGEGEECMYYVKNKNNGKHYNNNNNNNNNNNSNDNVFQQTPTTTCTSPSSCLEYKKRNEELQKQVGELRQLVGEREMQK